MQALVKRPSNNVFMPIVAMFAEISRCYLNVASVALYLTLRTNFKMRLLLCHGVLDSTPLLAFYSDILHYASERHVERETGCWLATDRTYTIRVSLDFLHAWLAYDDCPTQVAGASLDGKL
jgi:hypothetical protein